MASARTCFDLLWNPERLFRTGDNTQSLSSPQYCQTWISWHRSSALWSLLLIKSDQIQPDCLITCGISLSSHRISDLATAHMIILLGPLRSAAVNVTSAGSQQSHTGSFVAMLNCHAEKPREPCSALCLMGGDTGDTNWKAFLRTQGMKYNHEKRMTYLSIACHIRLATKCSHSLESSC